MKKFYEEVNEYRYMEIAVTLEGFQKKLRTHTHKDEGEHSHYNGDHSHSGGGHYQEDGNGVHSHSGGGHSHDGGRHTHYIEEYYYMDTDIQLTCRIPILMTDIGGDTPQSFLTRKQVSNIMSKDYSSYSITARQTNGIKLNIPNYIADSLPHDSNGYVQKGQNLIIVFISGDINNIKVIGRV